METKIKLTKLEMIEVFKTWNQDYLNNPNDFTEIADAEKSAQNQANEFIRILNELQSK